MDKPPSSQRPAQLIKISSIISEQHHRVFLNSRNSSPSLLRSIPFSSLRRCLDIPRGLQSCLPPSDLLRRSCGPRARASALPGSAPSSLPSRSRTSPASSTSTDHTPSSSEPSPTLTLVPSATSITARYASMPFNCITPHLETSRLTFCSAIL